MPASTTETQGTTETQDDIACSFAVLVEPDAPMVAARVFGLNSRERLERSFARSGLRTIEADALHTTPDERAVALCTSRFYDERLIAALVSHDDDVLLLVGSTNGSPVAVAVTGPASKVEGLIPALRTEAYSREAVEAAGVRIVSPADLVPAYDAKLRKHAPPFVILADADRGREAEKRIFEASYKGVTDFVTKWVWPLPARIVTRWCASLGIAPNTVTALSYLLAIFTLVTFWQGAFGLGLASGWLMTFLDTVDGKLARVTLTSSRLGDVLDHGLDIIHPPLWWAAWAAGLAGPGMLFGPFEVWAWIVFVGYIVGRLLEGLFILAFGQEMFTWRRFDFGFRLVIARRNPNLTLLSLATIAGRPDLGLIAVGSWTLCCIAIQCVRIAQAATAQRRGDEIRPFS